MEALYAPPNHPVFELVPPAFHEHISNLYAAIGQPEVTVETFWDIFRDLLGRLREGPDEHLTEITTCYDATCRQESDDIMPLLPNMEAFRLGQPLDLGPNANYIGGLDDPVLADGVPEFAVFTDSEGEESENDEDADTDGDDIEQ